MGQKVPPSTKPASTLFMIGKDSNGRWVVQDQRGLNGGLFVDRAQALKFALFENGNCPQAVVMVNRGYALIPDIASSIDIVMGEIDR